MNDGQEAHPDLDFEGLVNRYYQSLYRFALSLTRAEDQAADLTQQTFFILQNKGHQLRDPAKAKTWLFTTLHREHLNASRRQSRFPQVDLEEVESELPSAPALSDTCLDGQTVLQALAQVEEPYQAVVALFYLEDYPYKDIADILGIPIGTVKSRLARGLAQLQKILAHPMAGESWRDDRPHHHE